jgi:hypothetical protein
MRLVIPNLLLLSLLVTAGCLPSEQHPAKGDLRASDTPARVPAIVNAAETDDDATLADLVHALSDKDPAIRLFAIRSLHERTGQTLDYRYYEAAEQRQAAIDRWHDWLADQGISEPVLKGYDAMPTTED